MTSATIAVPAATEPWVLPSKGRVGMLCLIVAESAVFIIFVVAYLYYVGQSLSGPLPRDVLRAADLHQHLPAREQPDDFGGGARARTRAHGGVQGLVAGDDRPRRDLSRRHGARVVPADLRARADDPDQPVRHHLLFAGRAARVASDLRTRDARAGDGVLVARLSAPRARRAHAPASPCTGTSSIGCGSSCSRWSTSSAAEDEDGTRPWLPHTVRNSPRRRWCCRRRPRIRWR